MGKYQNPHTLAWSAKINSLDGFVFVAPEYNQPTSGALKNAIDVLFKESNNKAGGVCELWRLRRGARSRAICAW